MSKRPPFIISTEDVPSNEGKYPHNDEIFGTGRKVGVFAGLLRIGLHVDRLAPGQRTSYPHSEEDEEEFVFVLEGEVQAWVDGELHPMKKGDLAAFPAGTGINHTFINDSDHEVVLLIGGEQAKSDSRIFYPHNGERKKDMPWARWWDDVPRRPLGPHDGKPKPR